MAMQNVKFVFLQLLFLLISCSSVKDLKLVESRRIIYHSSRRELSIRTIQHDFFDPSTNTFPTTPSTNIPTTTPVFNPVTTPATTNPITNNPSPITVSPDTSTPAVVTIPSVNPITPSLPITNPPPTNPIMPPVTVTNPVTSPVPVTNPVTSPVPVTNPVTTPSTGIPAVGPPATMNPSGGSGSWCVVKGGATEATIQAALDYACGIGGADCASIQQGANCYSPVTLENHASYAFNSYYQKNPQPTSCDFGGAAGITNVNPSSGSCIYGTSSTSGSPTTASPVTTNPPNTASSSGATPLGGSSGNIPSILNATYPGFGGITNPTGSGTMPGFADGPQSPTGSSISMSTRLQPFIGFIVMVVSIVTGRILLEI